MCSGEISTTEGLTKNIIGILARQNRRSAMVAPAFSESSFLSQFMVATLTLRLGGAGERGRTSHWFGVKKVSSTTVFIAFRPFQVLA
jgi:hypothetical protein